jgi:hypothetical protein
VSIPTVLSWNVSGGFTFRKLIAGVSSRQVFSFTFLHSQTRATFKMVHHGDFPGLEVTVQIAGSPAVEYEDDEEIEVAPGPVGVYQAARTVSKYVEAVTGAEFSIKVSFSRTFKWDSPVIEVSLTVDGTWIVGGLIFSQPDAEVCRELQGVHQPPAAGNRSHEWTLKKLQFAQLDISKHHGWLAREKYFILIWRSKWRDGTCNAQTRQEQS